jgi:steroid delta-isomerase-like uncharacterized protein
MSPEANKTQARRVAEEVINKGNFDLAAELFTSNYIDHATPPGIPPGIEGFTLFFTTFRTAFPDLHYTIDDTFAEGNKVVQRVTGSGTHRGEFQGMPATNKHATWNEIHIVRYDGDKIVEHWGVIDQLSMLQQLGVIPAPGQAPR